MRIDGKRVRKSLKTTERTLAITKAKELQDKLGMASGGKVRFDEFSAKYLEWAWSSHPASAKGEELRLEIIKAFLLSHNVVHLSDITPYHIEQLKADLRARGRSPATINRYLQILRGMFYRAIDWEMYHKPNPLKKVRFYREEPCRKLLSQDEVKRIIEAAEAIATKPRSSLQRVFPDMIRLAINTGLRKSELLNLRWADVRGDEITVKGKGERTRTVPLNDEARRVIEHQARRTSRIFGDIGSDYTSVFRRTVEGIRKKSGVDWHFHLLRHYFGSTLLARGVDIVTIGSLLGHSRAMTTLIYSHTDEKRRREAVLRLSVQNGVPAPKNST
jgi:integrase